MTITENIAKHIREVHFGGNWTTSCLKDQVAGLTWQQATTQVHSFNTIATLVYHIHYFVHEVSKVLGGAPLEAKDEYSFAHPPIDEQADWEQLLETTWAAAENFAGLVAQLPDSILMEDFTHPKYGTYYRNLQGIIEHTHYHLGQIALIKKIILQQAG